MDWLKKSNEAIKADAECAYAMCEDTALKEDLEMDYVLDKFLEYFKKFWNQEVQDGKMH